MISAKLIANTHTYDPAWVAFISFLFIGIPFFIGGIIVMAILLKKRVKLHYEIIAAIIIVIIMVLSFSTMVHKSGLPGGTWKYNEELSELYKLSCVSEYDKYQVYLGKTTAQGREAAIYRYVPGWDEWEYIKTGIEKDGKLFINNWRVYPIEYVGISHIGENPYGAGQAVYLDNLTTAADTYTIYLKDDTGDFISNLSSYNALVGDVLAVFGEWEDAPIEGCENCDHLIVENIEVVEILS
jgi:hypothetical protein